MTNQNLNECTLVAGCKDSNLFLFKNADGPTLWDHEIIRDKINDIEVAYYTNSNGWAEGLNEYGIGLVYAYFTRKQNFNSEFELKGKLKIPSNEEIDPYYLSNKGKYLLNIITSKTIEEALKKVQTTGEEYDGNYYISNGIITYDIEKFKGEIECRIVNFNDKNDFRAKTNHGEQIPTAGHLFAGGSLRRGDSVIRKGNAERYLVGFETFQDVIQRMGFQEFDTKATYNLFRTDDKERTVSQILLDLNNKILNFIYYDHNAKFYGILSKLPKDYEPKIKINIFNRKNFIEIDTEEFKRKPQSTKYQINHI